MIQKILFQPTGKTRVLPHWSRRFIYLTLATASVWLASSQAGAAQNYRLTQTLLKPMPEVDDILGTGVTLSGDRALISSVQDSTDGFLESGAAYLFDTNTGDLLQKFVNPTPAEQDFFGARSALSGNKALISATFDDTAATDAGAAYLFDTDTGDLLQTFLSPNAAEGNRFGFPVALSGNRALIADPFDDTGASDSGAAYLFDIDTGDLLRTFVNPNPGIEDNFGADLNLIGNLALIGAPFDDVGASDSGAAYLFNIDTGELLQTFANPNPDVANPINSPDIFGFPVAISNNLALIGARGTDVDGVADSGAAYLFDINTGGLLQTFANPNPGEFDEFGDAVALMDNLAVIGAPLDDAGAVDSGAVYLFDTNTGNLVQTILNPTPDQEDFFGFGLALNEDNLLISAVADDDSGVSNSGIAYVFQSKSVPEPGLVSGLAWLSLAAGILKLKKW